MSYTGYPTSSQYRQWPAGSSATWPYMVIDTFNVAMGASATLTNATPADILATLYHSDFNSSSLVAGAVASWTNDGLDGAAAVQATASKKPVASATSYGGAPGVTGDGVDDSLRCTFNTPIANATRPYMWLVYTSAGAPGGFSPFALLAAPADLSAYCQLIEDNAGDGKWHVDATRADGTDHTSSSVSSARTSALIEIGLTASGTAGIVVNGTATNTTKTGATSAQLTILTLFAQDDGANECACVIRRLVLSSGEPSATQKTMMRAIMTALR